MSRNLTSNVVPDEIMTGSLLVGISSVGQITVGEFDYLDIQSALFGNHFREMEVVDPSENGYNYES